MTTAEFLNLLRGKDIRLWVESERLRCDAPVGAMTPELAGELADETRKTI